MLFNQFILFLNLGGGEVVLILFVILLLFGGKGIPSIAKALGKGIREFVGEFSNLAGFLSPIGSEN